jgi:hypothetical protein
MGVRHQRPVVEPGDVGCDQVFGEKVTGERIPGAGRCRLRVPGIPDIAGQVAAP